MRVKFQISLEPDDLERLDALAKRMGSNRPTIIERALRRVQKDNMDLHSGEAVEFKAAVDKSRRGER